MNKLFKCFITIAIISTFLCQNVAWAQGTSFTQVQRPNQLLDYIPANDTSIDLFSKIKIDPQIGTIRERWRPEPVISSSNMPPKLIIHIPDSHCNVEAQRNYAKIIELIEKQIEGPDFFIGLEGAAGLVDTSWLASLPDKKIKETIADYLLKEGFLTGAEYFSLFREEPILICGVENKGLYTRNLELFKECQKAKNKILQDLHVIKEILSKKIDGVCNKEQRKFIETANKYHNYSLGISDYSEYLFKIYQMIFGDRVTEIQDRYPSLQKIRQINDLNGKIELAKVESERDMLTEELKAKLVKEDMAKLVEHSLLCKVKKESLSEYHAFLNDLISEYEVDSGKYNNFIVYSEINKLYEELDSERVIDEAEILREVLASRLFRTKEQLDLYRLNKHIQIIEDMVGLELNRSGWEYYKKNRDRIKTDLIQFLDTEFMGKLNIDTVEPILRAHKSGKEDAFDLNVEKIIDRFIKDYNKFEIDNRSIIRLGERIYGKFKVAETQQVLGFSIQKEVEDNDLDGSNYKIIRLGDDIIKIMDEHQYEIEKIFYKIVRNKPDEIKNRVKQNISNLAAVLGPESVIKAYKGSAGIYFIRGVEGEALEKNRLAEYVNMISLEKARELLCHNAEDFLNDVRNKPLTRATLALSPEGRGEFSGDILSPRGRGKGEGAYPLHSIDLTTFEEYYLVAIAREDGLVGNAISRLIDSNFSTAILVTGAFHTYGLEDKLRQMDIPYMVVAPRLSQDDSNNPYLSVMLSEEIAFEKLLTGLGVRLAIPVDNPDKSSIGVLLSRLIGDWRLSKGPWLSRLRRRLEELSEIIDQNRISPPQPQQQVHEAGSIYILSSGIPALVGALVFLYFVLTCGFLQAVGLFPGIAGAVIVANWINIIFHVLGHTIVGLSYDKRAFRPWLLLDIFKENLLGFGKSRAPLDIRGLSKAQKVKVFMAGPSMNVVAAAMFLILSIVYYTLPVLSVFFFVSFLISASLFMYNISDVEKSDGERIREYYRMDKERFYKKRGRVYRNKLKEQILIGNDPINRYIEQLERGVDKGQWHISRKNLNAYIEKLAIVFNLNKTYLLVRSNRLFERLDWIEKNDIGELLGQEGLKEELSKVRDGFLALRVLVINMMFEDQLDKAEDIEDEIGMILRDKSVRKEDVSREIDAREEVFEKFKRSEQNAIKLLVYNAMQNKKNRGLCYKIYAYAGAIAQAIDERLIIVNPVLHDERWKYYRKHRRRFRRKILSDMLLERDLISQKVKELEEGSEQRVTYKEIKTFISILAIVYNTSEIHWINEEEIEMVSIEDLKDLRMGLLIRIFSNPELIEDDYRIIIKELSIQNGLSLGLLREVNLALYEGTNVDIGILNEVEEEIDVSLREVRAGLNMLSRGIPALTGGFVFIFLALTQGFSVAFGLLPGIILAVVLSNFVNAFFHNLTGHGLMASYFNKAAFRPSLLLDIFKGNLLGFGKGRAPIYQERLADSHKPVVALAGPVMNLVVAAFFLQMTLLAISNYLSPALVIFFAVSFLVSVNLFIYNISGREGADGRIIRYYSKKASLKREILTGTDPISEYIEELENKPDIIAQWPIERRKLMKDLIELAKVFSLNEEQLLYHLNSITDDHIVSLSRLKVLLINRIFSNQLNEAKSVVDNEVIDDISLKLPRPDVGRAIILIVYNAMLKEKENQKDLSDKMFAHAEDIARKFRVELIVKQSIVPKKIEISEEEFLAAKRKKERREYYRKRRYRFRRKILRDMLMQEDVISQKIKELEQGSEQTVSYKEIKTFISILAIVYNISEILWIKGVDYLEKSTEKEGEMVPIEGLKYLREGLLTLIFRRIELIEDDYRKIIKELAIQNGLSFRGLLTKVRHALNGGQNVDIGKLNEVEEEIEESSREVRPGLYMLSRGIPALTGGIVFVSLALIQGFLPAVWLLPGIVLTVILTNWINAIYHDKGHIRMASQFNREAVMPWSLYDIFKDNFLGFGKSRAPVDLSKLTEFQKVKVAKAGPLGNLRLSIFFLAMLGIFHYILPALSIFFFVSFLVSANLFIWNISRIEGADGEIIWNYRNRIEDEKRKYYKERSDYFRYEILRDMLSETDLISRKIDELRRRSEGETVSEEEIITYKNIMAYLAKLAVVYDLREGSWIDELQYLDDWSNEGAIGRLDAVRKYMLYHILSKAEKVYGEIGRKINRKEIVAALFSETQQAAEMQELLRRVVIEGLSGKQILDLYLSEDGYLEDLIEMLPRGQGLAEDREGLDSLIYNCGLEKGLLGFPEYSSKETQDRFYREFPNLTKQLRNIYVEALKDAWLVRDGKLREIHESPGEYGKWVEKHTLEMEIAVAHAFRVARIMMIIIEKLHRDKKTPKLKEEELLALMLGALLHDVGKASVPDMIDTYRRLEKDEIRKVNTHAAKSLKMLNMLLNRKLETKLYPKRKKIALPEDVIEMIQHSTLVAGSIEGHHGGGTFHTELIMAADMLDAILDGSRKYIISSGFLKSVPEVVDLMANFTDEDGKKLIREEIMDALDGIVKRGDVNLNSIISETHSFYRFYMAFTMASILEEPIFEPGKNVFNSDRRNEREAYSSLLDSINLSNLDIRNKIRLIKNIEELKKQIEKVSPAEAPPKGEVFIQAPGDLQRLLFINTVVRLDLSSSDLDKIRTGGIVIFMGKQDDVKKTYDFVNTKLESDEYSNKMFLLLEGEEGEIRLVPLREIVETEGTSHVGAMMEWLGELLRFLYVKLLALFIDRQWAGRLAEGFFRPAGIYYSYIAPLLEGALGLLILLSKQIEVIPILALIYIAIAVIFAVGHRWIKDRKTGKWTRAPRLSLLGKFLVGLAVFWPFIVFDSFLPAYILSVVIHIIINRLWLGFKVIAKGTITSEGTVNINWGRLGRKRQKNLNQAVEYFKRKMGEEFLSQRKDRGPPRELEFEIVRRINLFSEKTQKLQAGEDLKLQIPVKLLDFDFLDNIKLYRLMFELIVGNIDMNRWTLENVLDFIREYHNLGIGTEEQIKMIQIVKKSFDKQVFSILEIPIDPKRLNSSGLILEKLKDLAECEGIRGVRILEAPSLPDEFMQVKFPDQCDDIRRPRSRLYPLTIDLRDLSYSRTEDERISKIANIMERVDDVSNWLENLGRQLRLKKPITKKQKEQVRNRNLLGTLGEKINPGDIVVVLRRPGVAPFGRMGIKEMNEKYGYILTNLEKERRQCIIEDLFSVELSTFLKQSEEALKGNILTLDFKTSVIIIPGKWVTDDEAFMKKVNELLIEVCKTMTYYLKGMRSDYDSLLGGRSFAFKKAWSEWRREEEELNPEDIFYTMYGGIAVAEGVNRYMRAEMALSKAVTAAIAATSGDKPGGLEQKKLVEEFDKSGFDIRMEKARAILYLIKERSGDMYINEEAGGNLFLKEEVSIKYRKVNEFLSSREWMNIINGIKNWERIKNDKRFDLKRLSKVRDWQGFLRIFDLKDVGFKEFVDFMDYLIKEKKKEEKLNFTVDDVLHEAGYKALREFYIGILIIEHLRLINDLDFIKPWSHKDADKEMMNDKADQISKRSGGVVEYIDYFFRDIRKPDFMNPTLFYDTSSTPILFSEGEEEDMEEVIVSADVRGLGAKVVRSLERSCQDYLREDKDISFQDIMLKSGDDVTGYLAGIALDIEDLYKDRLKKFIEVEKSEGRITRDKAGLLIRKLETPMLELFIELWMSSQEGSVNWITHEETDAREVEKKLYSYILGFRVSLEGGDELFYRMPRELVNIDLVNSISEVANIRVAVVDLNISRRKEKSFKLANAIITVEEGLELAKDLEDYGLMAPVIMMTLVDGVPTPWIALCEDSDRGVQPYRLSATTLPFSWHLGTKLTEEIFGEADRGIEKVRFEIGDTTNIERCNKYYGKDVVNFFLDKYREEVSKRVRSLKGITYRDRKRSGRIVHATIDFKRIPDSPSPDYIFNEIAEETDRELRGYGVAIIDLDELRTELTTLHYEEIIAVIKKGTVCFVEDSYAGSSSIVLKCTDLKKLEQGCKNLKYNIEKKMSTFPASKRKIEVEIKPLNMFKNFKIYPRPVEPEHKDIRHIDTAGSIEDQLKDPVNTNYWQEPELKKCVEYDLKNKHDFYRTLGVIKVDGIERNTENILKVIRKYFAIDIKMARRWPDNFIYFYFTSKSKDWEEELISNLRNIQNEIKDFRITIGISVVELNERKSLSAVLSEAVNALMYAEKERRMFRIHDFTVLKWTIKEEKKKRESEEDRLRLLEGTEKDIRHLKPPPEDKIRGFGGKVDKEAVKWILERNGIEIKEHDDLVYYIKGDDNKRYEFDYLAVLFVNGIKEIMKEYDIVLDEERFLRFIRYIADRKKKRDPEVFEKLIENIGNNDNQFRLSFCGLDVDYLYGDHQENCRAYGCLPALIVMGDPMAIELSLAVGLFGHEILGHESGVEDEDELTELDAELNVDIFVERSLTINLIDYYLFLEAVLLPDSPFLKRLGYEIVNRSIELSEIVTQRRFISFLEQLGYKDIFNIFLDLDLILTWNRYVDSCSLYDDNPEYAKDYAEAIKEEQKDKYLGNIRHDEVETMYDIGKRGRRQMTFKEMKQRVDLAIDFIKNNIVAQDVEDEELFHSLLVPIMVWDNVEIPDGDSEPFREKPELIKITEAYIKYNALIKFLVLDEEEEGCLVLNEKWKKVIRRHGGEALYTGEDIELFLRLIKEEGIELGDAIVEFDLFQDSLFLQLLMKEGLKQGIERLEGYSKWPTPDGRVNYLNKEGRDVLGRMREALADPGSVDFHELLGLCIKIPTVKHSQTELLVDVFEDATREQMKGIIETGIMPEPELILQINKGCPEPCAHCFFEADKEISYMPFPLIVKTLRHLREKGLPMGSRISINLDNDPFNYYDRVLGADLSDVIREIYQNGFVASIVTHGWPEQNKIAQSAAEKIAKLPYDIDIIISVRFLSEEFISNPTPEYARIYAERFHNAIETLRPKKPELHCMRFKKHIRGNELFHQVISISYKFYRELKRRYSKEFIIKDIPILPKGRAYDLIYNRFNIRYYYDELLNFPSTSVYLVIQPDGNFKVNCPPPVYLSPACVFTGSDDQNFLKFLQILSILIQSEVDHTIPLGELIERNLIDKELLKRNHIHKSIIPYCEFYLEEDIKPFINIALPLLLPKKLLDRISQVGKDITQTDIDEIYARIKDIPIVYKFLWDLMNTIPLIGGKLESNIALFKFEIPDHMRGKALQLHPALFRAFEGEYDIKQLVAWLEGGDKPGRLKNVIVTSAGTIYLGKLNRESQFIDSSLKGSYAKQDKKLKERLGEEYTDEEFDELRVRLNVDWDEEVAADGETVRYARVIDKEDNETWCRIWLEEENIKTELVRDYTIQKLADWLERGENKPGKLKNGIVSLSGMLYLGTLNGRRQHITSGLRDYARDYERLSIKLRGEENYKEELNKQREHLDVDWKEQVENSRTVRYAIVTDSRGYETIYRIHLKNRNIVTQLFREKTFRTQRGRATMLNGNVFNEKGQSWIDLFLLLVGVAVVVIGFVASIHYLGVELTLLIVFVIGLLACVICEILFRQTKGTDIPMPPISLSKKKQPPASIITKATKAQPFTLEELKSVQSLGFYAEELEPITVKSQQIVMNDFLERLASSLADSNCGISAVATDILRSKRAFKPVRTMDFMGFRSAREHALTLRRYAGTIAQRKADASGDNLIIKHVTLTRLLVECLYGEFTELVNKTKDYEYFQKAIGRREWMREIVSSFLKEKVDLKIRGHFEKRIGLEKLDPDADLSKAFRLKIEEQLWEALDVRRGKPVDKKDTVAVEEYKAISKLMGELYHSKRLTPQIGRQAEVYEVEDRDGKLIAKVRDAETKKPLVDGELELTETLIDSDSIQEKLKTLVVKDGYEKDYLNIIDIAFSLLSQLQPEEAPNFYTYLKLIKDLSGFVWVMNNFNIVSLNDFLKDDPIANVHEIWHYLIEKELMQLKFKGRLAKLLKWLGLYERFKKINWLKGEIEIIAEDIEKSIPVRGEALSIALKDPDNHHYLLWALQRQMFGQRDKELTTTIKEKVFAEQLYPSIKKAVKEDTFSDVTEEEITRSAKGVILGDEKFRSLDEKFESRFITRKEVAPDNAGFRNLRVVVIPDLPLEGYYGMGRVFGAPGPTVYVPEELWQDWMEKYVQAEPKEVKLEVADYIYNKYIEFCLICFAGKRPGEARRIVDNDYYEKVSRYLGEDTFSKIKDARNRIDETILNFKKEILNKKLQKLIVSPVFSSMSLTDYLILLTFIYDDTQIVCERLNFSSPEARELLLQFYKVLKILSGKERIKKSFLPAAKEFFAYYYYIYFYKRLVLEKRQPGLRREELHEGILDNLRQSPIRIAKNPLPLTSPGKVTLDCGSGLSGIHVASVSDPDEKIWLLDNNPFMFRVLEDFVALTGKDNIGVIYDDMTTLSSIEDGVVSHIEAHQVFEYTGGSKNYLDEDGRIAFLRQAHRVLDENGTIRIIHGEELRGSPDDIKRIKKVTEEIATYRKRYPDKEDEIRQREKELLALNKKLLAECFGNKDSLYCQEIESQRFTIVTYKIIYGDEYKYISVEIIASKELTPPAERDAPSREALDEWKRFRKELLDQGRTELFPVFLPTEGIRDPLPVGFFERQIDDFPCRDFYESYCRSNDLKERILHEATRIGVSYDKEMFDGLEVLIEGLINSRVLLIDEAFILDEDGNANEKVRQELINIREESIAEGKNLNFILFSLRNINISNLKSLELTNLIINPEELTREVRRRGKSSQVEIIVDFAEMRFPLPGEISIFVREGEEDDDVFLIESIKQLLSSGELSEKRITALGGKGILYYVREIRDLGEDIEKATLETRKEQTNN